MATENTPIGSARNSNAGPQADAASIIEQWHAGIDLDIEQLKLLADMMLENRVNLMVSSYEFTRRVA